MPNTNKPHPLWLPRGTVRAILAITVVGAYVVARLALKVESAEFAALSGCVLTYYFKERSNENS